MSHQFRDFRDLVGYISQNISKDETRLLAFREDLPSPLQEEKPLIVLNYMINQQIIAENKLKEFEIVLKGISRKDLAEYVRKFSKRKKPGPSIDRNPISESEKLNLGMGATKLQAHLSHIHVQQLLQSMERQGDVPHQAVAELREAAEKCTEVCKILKSVAMLCAVSHPHECVGSDDDCSSLSSTLSNRDEPSLLQELTRATETIRRPIPETTVYLNRPQPCAAVSSPPQSPTKAAKGPATLPKPRKKPATSKSKSPLPLPSAAVPGIGVTPHPTGGVPLPIQSKDALVTGSNRLRPRHNPADKNAGTGSDSGFSDAREFLKVPVAESLAVFDEEQLDNGSLEDEDNLYATTTPVAYYKSLRSPPLATEYTSLQTAYCQEEQVLPLPEHIYEEPSRELDSSSSDDSLYAPLTPCNRTGQNSHP